MSSMPSIEVITLDGGDKLLVGQVQGQVIFMAVAVAMYDGDAGIGESIRYDFVGEHVGEVVGDFMKSPDIIKKILQFYEERYCVRNFADFKHHWKLTTQLEYKSLYEREKENLEELATQRKLYHFSKEREAPFATRMTFAHDIVRHIFPHVTYATLKSKELSEVVNGASIGISYEEYLDVVRNCILENPMGVGESLPSTTIGCRHEEVEEAKKLLNYISYGPVSCLKMQKKLYAQDMARLTKFATFQTLASKECYVYLGERFKYVAGAGQPRQMKRELLQHVNVVGSIMDQMDPVDLVRLRKVHDDDFDNAIQRKIEMLELMDRFGNPFRRNADEAKIHDPWGFDMQCKCVVIFYEVLRDVKIGNKSPDIERVVRQLLEAGKLDTFFSVKKWVKWFKPSAINASVQEIDAVYKYIYAKNRRN